MLNVVVLGSTGSIGAQTLDIVERFPDRLRVVGLAAGRNAVQLKEQAARFVVKHTALMHDAGNGIPSGLEAICELATLPEADIVVVSVAGVIGLKPTLAAIEAGKRIALASKEVLVAAGEVVMPLVRKKGTILTPIDSEHSAIFQCLQGYRADQVDKLILTASGGPFRGRSRRELSEITPEQALNHPTWRMGGKITVDSATMMNKGLETIEARWLFDVDFDHVRTVVHPQSVVHSMVQFKDGSVLGQLGWPDMRLPIAYSLLYPDRIENGLREWDPVMTPNLTFEEVDHEAFPSIRFAMECGKEGGTVPCAMNAANEEAANAFLQGKLSFLGIYDATVEAVQAHKKKDPTLENLLATDAEARQRIRDHIVVPQR
ncbi:MAG: 1-deoxy-D-xylulose-5-phosphate reductoisomerase [Armatimonadetes bacterium]|nr:1-deoxy-D-xylulose-5-phosphate reductoisomerase [Armatimonadota bacterium]